jgi:transposase, IS30 family
VVVSGGCRGRRLGVRDRRRVLELVSSGFSQPEVAAEVGCSRRTVIRVLQKSGGWPSRRARCRPRARLRLSLVEREEIRAQIAAGRSLRQIAARIGRAPSTVSREVKANGGRERYVATCAEDRAALLSSRPKPAKVERDPRLCEAVERMLQKYLSPRQISERLKIDHPDDPGMRISHETIYQSLFVQGKGRLRKDLTAYLRSGRKHRKPHGSKGPGGPIKDMIMISERPAEADDRAVPGHWEGDLIVGKAGRSFIGTLVERQTRFVMLTYLGEDSTTETVTAQIAQKIGELPGHLARSLTWDQGREMAAHHKFTVKTGVPVYFCDPHSPWQRGANENTNGLLRQFFPKGTCLAVHGQAHLDHVADLLNTRPRQTLGYLTPAEKMNELMLQ